MFRRAQLRQVVFDARQDINKLDFDLEEGVAQTESWRGDTEQKKHRHCAFAFQWMPIETAKDVKESKSRPQAHYQILKARMRTEGRVGKAAAMTGGFERLASAWRSSPLHFFFRQNE
jgi:hypothetical protein